METPQIFDLQKLYEKTFGSKPYVIQKTDSSQEIVEPYSIPSAVADSNFSAKGSILSETYNGVEVWLPVRFYDGPSLLMFLPYTVISITGKKTIVETAVAERKGTVKELFSLDDYSISIKGFLIGKDRKWPEDQMEQLKALYEKSSALTIDNALTNIFLTDPSLSNEEQRRCVIYDLAFSEVTGGRMHVRPFSMKLSSDSVFTLELKDNV
jgi:hypothetical protein